MPSAGQPGRKLWREHCLALSNSPPPKGTCKATQSLRYVYSDSVPPQGGGALSFGSLSLGSLFLGGPSCGGLSLGGLSLGVSLSGGALSWGSLSQGPLSWGPL